MATAAAATITVFVAPQVLHAHWNLNPLPIIYSILQVDIYLDLCLFWAYSIAGMFVFIFRQWPCEIWSVLFIRNGFSFDFPTAVFSFVVFLRNFTLHSMSWQNGFYSMLFGCTISVRTAQIVDCCNIRSHIGVSLSTHKKKYPPSNMIWPIKLPTFQ